MMFVKIRDENGKEFGDFHINISSLKERIDSGERFVLFLAEDNEENPEYRLRPMRL